MDLSIKKVIDKKDDYYTDMGALPNLPMKLIIVGKSHLSGKSTVAHNLITRFYNDHFEGKHIFVISKSMNICNKIMDIVKKKKVPELNRFKSFDETLLTKVYNMIESKYRLAVAQGDKPPNVLFYFDDCSYDGSLNSKRNGIFNKFFTMGRHINISVISCVQVYNDVVLNARRNLTALLFFNLSDKDLDVLIEEHSYIDRKKFKKIVRDNLKGSRHNFIVINYSNEFKDMIQNSKFESIPFLDE